MGRTKPVSDPTPTPVSEQTNGLHLAWASDPTGTIHTFTVLKKIPESPPTLFYQKIVSSAQLTPETGGLITTELTQRIQDEGLDISVPSV